MLTLMVGEVDCGGIKVAHGGEGNKSEEKLHQDRLSSTAKTPIREATGESGEGPAILCGGSCPADIVIIERSNLP